MKKVLKVCLVLVMALSLFACTKKEETVSESDEPVTITFWHTLTDQHYEALKEVIDGFNASQDKIIVQEVQKPYADFDANILMGIANGTGPDFVSRYATDAVEYLADDLIVDMTDYIVEAYGSMDAWKDELVGEVYNECTQLGGAYLFPLTSSSQVLFYNADVFAELNLAIPTTWDELQQCAQAIHEAYPDMIAFTTDDELDDFQGIMTQKGYDYIDMDKKEIAWPKEATTELLQWYVDNVTAGNFTLKELGTYCSNDYASGKTGMYIGSSAGATYACWGNSWDGIAPIPQEGTKNYIANWGGGYVIFKSTEEKQKAAFEFLKYYASADVVAKWAEGFTTVPCWKDAYETETYKNYAETSLSAKAMTAQSDAIGWLQACTGSETVREEIQKMIRTACSGEVSVQQAVETFYTNSNAALKG